MNHSLWIAKTGLEAQQMRVATIANNLANVNTTGYKRSRINFEDLLYQNVQQPGAQSSDGTTQPTGTMIGVGVRVANTEKTFTQGQMTDTGNDWNAAIEGKGFYKILLPSGTVAYTRDGSFKPDPISGQLVNASGYPIEPAITIPTGFSNVQIMQDGTVAFYDKTGKEVGTGAIILSDFPNSAGLQPIGGNLYQETVASGTAVEGTPGKENLGSLKGGWLEASNVNVVEELVNMIEAQRAYEMNSKAIKAGNEMLQYINNQL